MRSAACSDVNSHLIWQATRALSSPYILPIRKFVLAFGRSDWKMRAYNTHTHTHICRHNDISMYEINFSMSVSSCKINSSIFPECLSSMQRKRYDNGNNSNNSRSRSSIFRKQNGTSDASSHELFFMASHLPCTLSFRIFKPIMFAPNFYFFFCFFAVLAHQMDFPLRKSFSGEK